MNDRQVAAIAEGVTGAVAATGAAIYGGIKSGKLNRQAEKILQGQKDYNEQWWNVKRNTDYTQRADVQAAIKKQRELLDEQYKRARATNVVAGGTDEALALQKQSANQALAQTATDVASRVADIKDNQEQQYLGRKANLEDQERLNLQQRSAATSAAASQVVNAGINMVGSGAQHYASASGAGGANMDPEAIKGAQV